MATKTYNIYSDKLPNENPFRIKWNGATEWSKINYAEIHVNLADNGSGIPLVQWRLTRIDCNGKSFLPSAILQSKNIITSAITVNENTFDIHRAAPLGTGFIFGQIYCDVTLIIQGEPQYNPVAIGLGGFQSLGTTFKNITMQTEDKAKSQLPFFIFIVVVIVIIMIALVVLVQKIPNEAISDGYKGLKSAGPTVSSGINKIKGVVHK